MLQIAIAFNKELNMLLIGIDKGAEHQNAYYSCYADKIDTKAPNMNYYSFLETNTKQFAVYKKALRELDELFCPILK